MGSEAGEGIRKGPGWKDPYRIRSFQDLTARLGEAGFLPLSASEVPGFS